MAFDAHKNLAVSAVAVAPSPPTSGTSLTVTAGHGTRFATPPFNVTVAAAGLPPDPTTAEVARVTGIAGDGLTVLRAQEGTTARAILVGDVIALSITAKTLTDIEAAVNAAPSLHHATHEPGGTDALTSLDASVLTTGTVASARLATQQKTRAITVVFGTGSAVITAGLKTYVSCPYTGTITAARLLAVDASVTSGSIVIDVWKRAYATYPPTVANTITASAKPTLSSATKSDDTTLTGWATAVTAGDVFGFTVDSASLVTQVALQLTLVLN